VEGLESGNGEAGGYTFHFPTETLFRVCTLQNSMTFHDLFHDFSIAKVK